MHSFKNMLQVLIITSFFAVLAGCAGVVSLSPQALPLTNSEELMVANAIEQRLLQMLGGAYHDDNLAAELNRLGQAVNCHVVIVDRSAVEMYPLPGARVIVTRGLLAQLKSHKQLENLLARASLLSRSAYTDNAGRDLSRALAEFLSGEPSHYDPDAADIRMAEVFAENSCARSCLDGIFLSTSAGDTTLLDPLVKLKAMQPGYELLVKARQLEKSGEQSQAIATYLQAATMTPDKARILGALGMAYLRAGELQSARLHLEKADMLQAEYYKTKMGLGYLYLHTGQVERANSALVESVKLLPVTENLFLLAEAREKSGDSAGAMSLYRVVAEEDRYGKLGRSAVQRMKQQKGTQ